MGISSFLKNLIHTNSQDENFIANADFEGIRFTIAQDSFEACKNNQGSNWLLHQFVCFQTLVEQGYAKALVNGFFVPSESVVLLDQDSRALLDLAPHFKGHYLCQVKGLTSNKTFSVQIIPISSSAEKIHFYDIKGPLLQVTRTESYLLSPAELIAFHGLIAHQELSIIEKTEHINLQLVAELQRAKQKGMKIDLSHFNDLMIYQPDKISVSAAQMDDGSLMLIPSFGTGASPVDINNRLGQLPDNEHKATLRVGKQIILLNEERLKATDEIISNRHIPKKQVNAFLEAPGAFLDAALVDLDTGFSIRVKGAGEFTYLNMGETDALDIDWFSQTDVLLNAGHLQKILTTQEDIDHFQELYKKAKEIGSKEIIFNSKRIDISDNNKIDHAVRAIISDLSSKQSDEAEPIEQSEASESKRSVIDIDEIEAVNHKLQEQIDTPQDQDVIDYSVYPRSPFAHQKDGIEWLLELTNKALMGSSDESDQITGALLADDMGLGKTYMILISISEMYKKAEQEEKICKPILIVAPLSLLENWEDELSKTFSKSPFDDVVVLQSARDLKQYKVDGAGNETRQNIIDGEVLPMDAIKYSLKIGQYFGPERLDMPKRLVLTTYHALRDYQFSLCRIDWGYVIFDEAQNIKNPNTLQTRAAKGLKADFKILATGTPVENNLGDFWCLMDTAQPGLLGSWSFFRDKYIKPINSAAADNLNSIRNKVGKQLRDDVGRFMLRRLKEDNLKGLPEKRLFSGVECKEILEWNYMDSLASTMTSLQLERYNDVIDDFSIISETKTKKGHALSVLIKLRELSLHPNLQDENQLFSDNKSEALSFIKQSAKLDVILLLLEQIMQRNEKVIIFLINKKLQRSLKIWLEKIYKITISIINGDTKAVSNKDSSMTRKGLIDRFQQAEGFGVIIMSPIAAGVGLTVTGANNVIHLERHWNPAKEAQATDRVYRIGQQKEVNVYIPIAHHPERTSFDVNLDRLLSQKSNLKDAVVSPQIVSAEDMKGLFVINE